jgi:hypothetical protein
MGNFPDVWGIAKSDFTSEYTPEEELERARDRAERPEGVKV